MQIYTNKFSTMLNFHKKDKTPPIKEGFYIIRHRAIFPGLDDPSIVTAARLNCCVRNGNRCFPSAMGTDTSPPLMRAYYRCPMTMAVTNIIARE